jgi:hypothetical protein
VASKPRPAKRAITEIGFFEPRPNTTVLEFNNDASFGFDAVRHAIQTAGLVPEYGEMRWPHYHSNTNRAQMDWHQDAVENVDGSKMFMVLWAWPSPTEFRDIVTKEIIPTRPGAILLVDNSRVEHKPPELDLDESRWLVRFWNVKEPTC